MGWEGGRGVLEGGDICIHMADSQCCAAEADTTLQSNYIIALNSFKKSVIGTVVTCAKRACFSSNINLLYGFRLHSCLQRPGGYSVPAPRCRRGAKFLAQFLFEVGVVFTMKPGQESNANAGDSRSIPGSGRSPGEGNGNPFQRSCLENPTDRGAWVATIHGIAKSWM